MCGRAGMVITKSLLCQVLRTRAEGCASQPRTRGSAGDIRRQGVAVGQVTACQQQGFPNKSSTSWTALGESKLRQGSRSMPITGWRPTSFRRLSAIDRWRGRRRRGRWAGPMRRAGSRQAWGVRVAGWSLRMRSRLLMVCIAHTAHTTASLKLISAQGARSHQGYRALGVHIRAIWCK